MLKRREFLVSALSTTFLTSLFDTQLSSAIAAQLARKAAGQEARYLVCAFTTTDLLAYQDKQNMIAQNIPGMISVYDTDKGNAFNIDVPIWAHVYDQNPVRPECVLGAGKWTDTAIYVDLKNRKVISRLKAPDDFKFFGHSVFTENGTKAYLSAHSNLYDVGKLCLYDLANGRFEKLIDVGIRKPHECIINSKNLMLVAGTEPLSSERHGLNETRGMVALLNPENGQILDRFSVRKPVSHITEIDADTYALGGGAANHATELGVLRLSSRKVIYANDCTGFPKTRVKSEALSLARINDSKFAATLPELQSLVIWDLKTNHLAIQKFESMPWGVVAKNDDLLVNHIGKKSQLSRFAKINDGFSLVSDQSIYGLANGRHMRLMTLNLEK